MQSNYSLHCDNCFQQTKYGGSTFSTKVEVVRSIIVVHDFYKVQTVINFTLIRSNIRIIIAIRFEDWKIIKYDKFIKKKKLILFE